MRIKLSAMLVAAACAFGALAFAHQSFPASYLIDEEIQIEGALAAFSYRAPHSVVQLTVTDDSGETARWTIEWASPSFLQGQGFTRHTLKPGDPLIITGNPGRDPEENRMLLRSLERSSDGLRWPTDPDNAEFD